MSAPGFILAQLAGVVLALPLLITTAERRHQHPAHRLHLDRDRGQLVAHRQTAGRVRHMGELVGVGADAAERVRGASEHHHTELIV